MNKKFLFESNFYPKSNKYLTNFNNFSFSFCSSIYNVRKPQKLKEKLAKTSLRFIRRASGFPIRGQRTCTNGRTAKKKL